MQIFCSGRNEKEKCKIQNIAFARKRNPFPKNLMRALFIIRCKKKDHFKVADRKQKGLRRKTVEQCFFIFFGGWVIAD